MFKDAKLGDRAWNIQAGWGTIYHIHKESSYPIEFKSDISNKYYSFTYNGLSKTSDINPSLFWNEFPIAIPETAFIKPPPKLEVNTKVIVWREPNSKFNRYFSHFDNKGQIHCFSNGGTSWSVNSTSSWPNWELVDE